MASARNASFRMTFRQGWTLCLLMALALFLAGCGDNTREEPEPKSDGGQAGTLNMESGPDNAVVTASRPPAPEGLELAQDRSARMRPDSRPWIGRIPPPEDRERYEDTDPNKVVAVADQPVSTFSVDVDTASYAVVRRYLNDGVLPPSDAVRVEEMINYFDYAYPAPDDPEKPFAPALEVMPTPWNADTQLLRIGLKGYELDAAETPAVNLVLLVDVSGSMQAPDKLPLLKKALALLVDTMDADDRIAVVVYAGAAGVVLDPTAGTEKGKILAAIEGLSAGGSTAGGEGIRLAYTLAERNFDADRINRVILATDGDFNVGITDPEKLEDFVTRKRESGVFLTILGFGRGNLNDVLMQKLAQSGNGQAAYIDTLKEARKVLVDGVRATLFPIAKDVKIQVEFNPARVAEYRLIGYETRLLDRSDFNNDKVDAGEVGSGHAVTALYEIATVDSEGRVLDPLRYQPEGAPDDAADDAGAASGTAGEYAFVRLRYKLPDEDESRLIEMPVDDGHTVGRVESASQEARFAAAVATFGQLLRADPHLKTISMEDILTLAQDAKGEDPYGYRAEFTQLLRLAQSAAALESASSPPPP